MIAKSGYDFVQNIIRVNFVVCYKEKTVFSMREKLNYIVNPLIL